MVRPTPPLLPVMARPHTSKVEPGPRYIPAQSLANHELSGKAPPKLGDNRALDPFVGSNTITTTERGACRPNPISKPWVSGLHCVVEQLQCPPRTAGQYRPRGTQNTFGFRDPHSEALPDAVRHFSRSRLRVASRAYGRSLETVQAKSRVEMVQQSDNARRRRQSDP
jgi:hypothetical protein